MSIPQVAMKQALVGVSRQAVRPAANAAMAATATTIAHASTPALVARAVPAAAGNPIANGFWSVFNSAFTAIANVVTKLAYGH